MSRRGSGLSRYYCPACGKKTLGKDQRYSGDHNRWFQVWRCGTWLSTPTKPPHCGLEISTPGRDAEISDYGCVLDQMILYNTAIERYLFEHDPSVKKRGLKVLHSTDVIDVVRLRDFDGLVIRLYWKSNWEPGYDGLAYNQATMAHTAASYIEFEPSAGPAVPLQNIFRMSTVTLWAREQSKNQIFSGEPTKELLAEIIQWASDLEAQLPELCKKAAAAEKAWVNWGEALKRELSAINPRVKIRSYDQIHERVTIAIDVESWVTPGQVKAVATALASIEDLL